MADDPTRGNVSRRAALKILAGTAGAAVPFPILDNVRALAAEHLAHPLRPSPAAAPAYTPKFFDAGQMESLAALAETIIPTDEHSPGARAARVHEFIDEIVAIADDAQKVLWRDGLGAVEKLAQAECGKKFAQCAATQQVALLEKISGNEEHPSRLEEKFFVAIKNATIDGYYNSAIGIHQDLQYQGNTAVAEFEGCTHPEHKAAPDTPRAQAEDRHDADLS